MLQKTKYTYWYMHTCEQILTICQMCGGKDVLDAGATDNYDTGEVNGVNNICCVGGR